MTDLATPDATRPTHVILLTAGRSVVWGPSANTRSVPGE